MARQTRKLQKACGSSTLHPSYRPMPYTKVPQRAYNGPGPVLLEAVCCGFVKTLVTLALLCLGVYLFTVLLHSIPLPGVTDLPAPLDTDSYFISLQSLKHIVFESGVASYYAPAPPPPRR